jgi:hypothetical protein
MLIIVAEGRRTAHPPRGWPRPAFPRTACTGFSLAHPDWVEAMAVWSYAFDPDVWRLGALVLVIWLLRRGAAPVAWWVVITMTLGGMLGALLKLLVGRDRPDLLEPVARATGFSFPSGHALNSALGAGVFLLVLLPFTGGRPGRRIALWAVVVAVAAGHRPLPGRTGRALDQRCHGGLAARCGRGGHHRGGLRGVATALRPEARRRSGRGRGAGGGQPRVARPVCG